MNNTRAREKEINNRPWWSDSFLKRIFKSTEKSPINRQTLGKLDAMGNQWPYLIAEIYFNTISMEEGHLNKEGS